MGFMDELKKLTRPYAEDEDDFDDDFDLDDRPRASRASTAPRTAPRASAYDEVLDDLGSSRSSAPASRRTSDSKVVNISAQTQMQVMIEKPDRYDNVNEIADHIRSKHAVVLNLEATNKDVARRLVDFLSGVAYANNGQIKRVANSTYIITPYNVDIMGDLLDELEINGALF